MGHPKRLTPVEWEVMETVWKLGGAPSVREVVNDAYPNGEKAYTTIQTVMNTLVKKGFLKPKKIGLVNFYRPTRTRRKMISVELDHIASRMFQGSKPALASHLLDAGDLTLKEIESLKVLLDKKKDALKDKDHD